MPPAGDSVSARAAWIALPAQVVLTGAISWVVIAVWIVVGGLFTEGLQVVGIAVFATAPTILAFVVGLPLRLAPRARAWWFHRRAWAPVVFGVAVLGLLSSYLVGGAGPVHNAAGPEWPATDGYDPDVWVFAVALGVAAVASMHLLPPRRVWPATS